MANVEGTRFEVCLTSRGYYVMLPTQRRVVPTGAPIMLSVTGPYETRAEAERRAREEEARARGVA